MKPTVETLHPSRNKELWVVKAVHPPLAGKHQASQGYLKGSSVHPMPFRLHPHAPGSLLLVSCMLLAHIASLICLGCMSQVLTVTSLGTMPSS